MSLLREPRVLVVEDNEGDVLLVREALRAEGLGARVEEAGTLAAALAALEEPDGFDVILLDLSLPDSAGIETVRAVTAVAGSVPVVVLSGHDDLEGAVRAVQEGAQDYLVKGFRHAGELARAIRHAMDRKRAQERIQLQARLLDAVGQAVFAVDPETVVTYWGAGAERVFGWTREEALGRRSDELIMPDTDEARERQQAIREAMGAGRDFHHELVARRKDGTPVVLDATGTPFLDDQGALVGMVGVATDISDRKAAETALRESERRFRALIENASDAVLILDRDAVPRYASPQARRILGAMADGPAAAWAEGVHPDDLGALEAAWRRVLAAPHVEEAEAVEVRAADGDGWRALEVRLRNLLEVGGVEGVVVHARDVTERRDLEQRLRQAQRLEVVGRLAGGIAHDFNNIVMGMQGFVQLALDDLPPAPRAGTTWRRSAAWPNARPTSRASSWPSAAARCSTPGSWTWAGSSRVCGPCWRMRWAGASRWRWPPPTRRSR